VLVGRGCPCTDRFSACTTRSGFYYREQQSKDVDGETQRALAIWAMFVVAFVLLTGFLFTHGELTLGFVGIYWLGPVIATAIGVLPPPWAALPS
jgi:hypothetical protein